MRTSRAMRGGGESKYEYGSELQAAEARAAGSPSLSVCLSLHTYIYTYIPSLSRRMFFEKDNFCIFFRSRGPGEFERNRRMPGGIESHEQAPQTRRA